MKENFILFIIIFQFIFSNVKAENKLYYIDMNYIINNSNAGKVVLKNIQETEINLSNYIKKNEKTILRKQNELNNQKNILSNEEIEAKVKVLENEIKEFNKDRKNKIEELETERKNDLDELINKISPILKDYMKTNNIDYIFKQSSILMANSRLNVTEDILKLVNEKIKNND